MAHRRHLLHGGCLKSLEARFDVFEPFLWCKRTGGDHGAGPAYGEAGRAVSLGSEPLCLSVAGSGAPFAVPNVTVSPANS